MIVQQQHSNHIHTPTRVVQELPATMTTIETAMKIPTISSKRETTITNNTQQGGNMTMRINIRDEIGMSSLNNITISSLGDGTKTTMKRCKSSSQILRLSIYINNPTTTTKVPSQHHPLMQFQVDISVVGITYHPLQAL